MLINNLTDLKQKRIIISIHKLLKIYSIQKKAKTSFFSKKKTKKKQQQKNKTKKHCLRHSALLSL